MKLQISSCSIHRQRIKHLEYQMEARMVFWMKRCQFLSSSSCMHAISFCLRILSRFANAASIAGWQSWNPRVGQSSANSLENNKFFQNLTESVPSEATVAIRSALMPWKVDVGLAEPSRLSNAISRTLRMTRAIIRCFMSSAALEPEIRKQRSADFHSK